MDFRNPRYVGGGLLDICLTITSPTKDDKGKYSCTVKNIVGSTSKDVILGNVQIWTSMCFFYNTNGYLQVLEF